jgi:hypothetical protein
MAFAITATKTTKNDNSSTSVHSSVQGSAQSRISHKKSDLPKAARPTLESV